MNRCIRFAGTLLIIWVLGELTFCLATIYLKQNSIAIIICADNPVAFRDNASLSVQEVRSYFLRKPKKSWPETNKSILPVDREKPCPEQVLFYSHVLKMTTSEVKIYFVTKQYQTGEKPPESFLTDKEIIDYVGDEIGAIGYINLNSLTGEARTKVKVVLTISNQ